MTEVNNTNKNTDKNMPKMSIYKVINKSFLVWGIKVDDKIRVYYKHQLKKRTKPLISPFIIVDYDSNEREWYITYITNQRNSKVYSCTVDDITGSPAIKIF